MLSWLTRISCAVFLVATVCAGPLYAAAASTCCACSVEPVPEATAYFCATILTSDENEAAQQRCQNEFPDAAFICFASPDTGDCVGRLRESGIQCPDNPAAPALGNMALTGLAVLLGVFGAVTLRRGAVRHR